MRGNAIERDGSVATIVPGSLDGGIVALREHLQALRDEDKTWVVVLDCASVDVDAEAGDATLLRHFPLPLVCAWPAQPSPAAFAIGLFCDIRVAAEGFVVPSVPATAIEAQRSLVCGGRTAEESRRTPLAAGLISALLPGDGVIGEAQRLAGVIAQRGPLATQLAKEAIWRGAPLPLEHALRFETDLTLLLQTTNDRAEGVNAFVEKRTPRFVGT